MLDPELDVGDRHHQLADIDLFAPGALMSGITLLAVLLVEIERLGAIVKSLERERMNRENARLHREAVALANGHKPPGRPGRPRKIASNGASAPPA